MLMQPETVLSSHRIYAGRTISLRVDEVRTPSGIAAQHEIVEHRGAVALVAFDDEGRVVLIRQYRRAAGKTLIEIPAGTLEPGEDVTACAARELVEETGYSAAHLERLGGIYPSPGFCTEFIHFFIATGLTRGDARPEADEIIEVEAVPWDEALRRVRAGEIQDAKSISALLLVDARRRQA